MAHRSAWFLFGMTHPHPLRYPSISKSHSRRFIFPVLQRAMPHGWKRQATTSSAPSLALKPR